MAWMDNINRWTGLPVGESVRMTEDRDKWRKYIHGRDAESSFFVGLKTPDFKKLGRLESRLTPHPWLHCTSVHASLATLQYV